MNYYSFTFLLILTSNLINFIQCISLNYQGESEKTEFFQATSEQRPLANADHLTNKEKQQAIKEAFLFAWKGYVEHSFGYDENRPVSNTPLNTRNGWGATIVDSLDTLYIMGLKDEFEIAKNHVAKIQWDQVVDEVQVFETVIRYVGGLISAYELSQEKIFIKKCVELVDLLLPAFNTPTNIPHQYIVLKTGKVSSSTSFSSGSELTNIAEAATCQLEFTRLSQITGDWKYHFTGQRVYKAFKKMKTPYKGLFPHLIDINTGQARSDYYSWGGMADSFYEYLIKQYVLTKDEEKKEMAIQAILGMKTFLLQQPQGDAFQQLKFIGTINEDQHYPAMGELACFAPGSILLASREIPELRNQSDDGQLEKDAHALLLGCYQAWISTRSGIAPEGFAWIPENGASLDNLNDRQMELAKTFGVFPYGASDYILRPETLESIFYFYQYYKDPIYQDMAWTLFKSINQYCKANSGYSGINDVDSTSPRWNDRQESFLFAETFKYLYIIWDEEARFPFDQWVFNTEAHPFRITDIHPPSAKAFVQFNHVQ